MHVLENRAMVRTLVILGLMFALVMQLGYLLAFLFGADFGLKAILFMIAVAVLADIYAYMASDTLVLKLTGAKVVSREQAPQLHALLDDMTIASGLPRPKLAIVEDAAPNAFATGRDPEHSAIAFTTGLMERLEKDEQRAVMAHEMAHIYNRDILVSTVGAVAVRLVTSLANGLIYFGLGILTAPGSGSRNKQQQEGENAARMFGLGILLIGSLIAITLVPALFLLQFALSRSRETMADTTGARFSKDPEALARALQKISSDPTETAVNAQGISHLWISPPKFAGGALGNWISNLSSSHPAPEQRIRALRAMASGQSLDLAHDTRGGYGAGLSLLAACAIALTAIPAYLVGQMPQDFWSTTDSASYSDSSTDGGYQDDTSTDYGSDYGSDFGAGTDESYTPLEEEPQDAEGSIGDPEPEDIPTDSEDAEGGIGN